MSGALAARPTDKEPDKGRVESTRVRRYWAGKAPAWVEQQLAEAATAEEAIAQGVQRTAISAPVVVKRAADPRLARLQARAGDRAAAVEEHRQIRAAEVVRRRRHAPSDDEEASSGGGSGDERPRRRRQQQGDEAQPYSSEGEEDEEEEEEEQQQQEQEVDEEELQRRRDALRERLRQQQQQQQELLVAAGDGEDEEEGSSEYTTDDESDEDAAGGPKLVKPVFVRKSDRETIAAREAAEREEEEAEEAKKERLVERQQETRQLLVAAIAADEAAARAANAPAALKEAEDVDTGDEAEPDAIDAWQRREAARIRRDHAEREAAEAAAAERERLKNMTEEERVAYLRANPKEAEPRPDKAKWRFMQKYWHKGAFFQSTPDDARGTAGVAEVYGRDYSAPTGEDLFDKAALPEVMQVRNFGRSGRTKWKHLLAEDTSVARREDDWYRRDERLAGAVSGGYARDAAAVAPGLTAGGAAKRGGDPLVEGFVKPKKFKT